MLVIINTYNNNNDAKLLKQVSEKSWNYTKTRKSGEVPRKSV